LTCREETSRGGDHDEVNASISYQDSRLGASPYDSPKNPRVAVEEVSRLYTRLFKCIRIYRPSLIKDHESEGTSISVQEFPSRPLHLHPPKSCTHDIPTSNPTSPIDRQFLCHPGIASLPEGRFPFPQISGPSSQHERPCPQTSRSIRIISFERLGGGHETEGGLVLP